MELSLLMKFRICAAMGLGVVLIGILAWPLAAPLDPFGVVSVPAGGSNSSSGFGFIDRPISIFCSMAFRQGDRHLSCAGRIGRVGNPLE
ncbi:MAG: hypothetical protein ACYSYU_11425 [Planctomycetota bacterium]